MKVRINNTELKEGHTLPMTLSGRCSACYSLLLRLQKQGIIPADRDLSTVFVNRTGEFAYKCVNSRCEEGGAFYTLKCVLRHRDFKVATMDIELESEAYVTEEGIIDLDHPKMQDFISLHYGPIKDCPGHLDWTGDKSLDGADYLVCSFCAAIYKAFVFSTYNSHERKLNMEHNEFELLVTSGTGNPYPIRRRSPMNDKSTSVKVPKDWCLVISEVDYLGTKFSFWKNM